MGLLDRFVGRLTRGQSSGPYALDEDDRRALGQQGLLQAGLTMLATPSNGMQGVARGLLAGVQGVQGGADALVNDRYRNDVMSRTRAQMEANTARENAFRGILNPDGTLNEQGFATAAQIDPFEAMRLRQQIEAANAPKPLTPRDSRKLLDGGYNITQEFDPATGQWQEVARAPRWMRGSGGGGGSSAGGGGGTGGGAASPSASPAASGGLAPRPGQPSANEIKERMAAARLAPQLAAVRRRIKRIKAAVGDLSDNRFFGTGFLDQFINARTEEGQELESAVGGIQNPLLALTRVPGIGSQSDLEARIANLQFPHISKDEGVNIRDVAELEAFYADLENAYRNILGDEFDAAMNQRPDAPAEGGGTGKAYQVGEVITLGGKRYRVVGGDPADPELEEIR